MPRNIKSSINNYGGTRRHRVEHNYNIQKNFTQDNEDYYPNSVQYNDTDEVNFNAEDRLAYEHRDLPENRYDDRQDYRPSNYSEGGHGRRITPQEERRYDNTDNRDYLMNKEFNRGAARRYENSDDRYVRDEQEPQEHNRYPEDERYRQTDWAPQDRYNQIAPDRHREATQDRFHPQLNSNPNHEFDYHYGSDYIEELEQEPRRRGRHYREY